MRLLILSLAFIISYPLLAFGKDTYTKDMNRYMSKLEQSIKSNWKPPKQERDSQIIAFFTIDTSGKISNLKLLKKSKSSEANKAAEDAILSSKPIALPSSSKGKSIDIEFTFDYNIHKSQAYKLQQDKLQEEFELKLVRKYIKAVKKRIEKSWVAPKMPKAYTIKSFFEIKRDGTMLNARLQDKSEYQEANDRALNTLRAASPFAHPPKSMFESDKDTVTLSFIFESKGHR